MDQAVVHTERSSDSQRLRLDCGNPVMEGRSKMLVKVLTAKNGCHRFSLTIFRDNSTPFPLANGKSLN
mgnify:CR=1 FL=1